MPAASSKANYKTYEAQARMVRAMVAAHPEVKWNYKEIAACYGSDMSDHALNHRFRRLRAQSVIVREGRKQGFDMKNLVDRDLPITQEAVDKKNIAKYFGQSTGDGIQFQFRTIKKDADQLRKTYQDGGNVANCLNLSGGASSVTSTPTKPAPSRSTSNTGTGTGTARKRTRKIEIKASSSDEASDEEDLDTENWSEREETPSKRPKNATTATVGGAIPGQKNGTPSRRAALKANVTIAEVSAQLEMSDSQPEPDMPTTTIPSAPLSAFAPVQQQVQRQAQPYESIFGNVDQKPYVGPSVAQQPQMGSFRGPPVARSLAGSYFLGRMEDDRYGLAGADVEDSFHGDCEI